MRPMPTYPPIQELDPVFAGILAHALGDCLDIMERAIPGIASDQDFMKRLPVRPIRRGSE